MIRVTTVVSLLALGGTLPGQEEPEVQEIPIPGDQGGGVLRKITLQDAMRMGLSNNLDFKAQALLPFQARQDLIVAQALYEPELYGDSAVSRSETPTRNVFQPSITRESFTGTLGWRQRMLTGGLFDVAWTTTRLEQDTSTSGFPSKQFINEMRTTLTQPLLRGGWSDYGLAAIRIQRHREAAARHDLERSRQQLLLDVVRAYWELVFVRENYRVVREALVVAQEQLRITSERIRVGDMAARDRIADEAEVARRREEMIRALAEIENRADTLRELLLGDRAGRLWQVHLVPTTPFEIEGKPPAPVDWRTHASIALRERPDLDALRSDAAAGEKELLQAERDLLPQVDLVGSYSTDGVRDEFRQSQMDVTSLDFPDWSVQLQFVLPIGNSGARANLTRARLELERRRRLLHASEQRAIGEVRDAVREIETNAQSIAASRESVRLAATNLETEQIKLRVGSTTIFEVQRRNQELREARGRLLRNLLDYRIAWSNLDFVQGVLNGPDGR